MQPFFNNGSTSDNTIAAVLFVSTEMNVVWNTVSLPVQIIKDHKYPELDSHSSYHLIPNLEDFRGIYCLKESLPLHSVSDSSIAMFCPGKYKL